MSSRCQHCVLSKCFVPLRLILYTLSFLTASSLTFFPLPSIKVPPNTEIALAIIALVFFIIIALLEIAIVIASCGAKSDSKLHVSFQLKMYYLFKGVSCFILIMVAINGIQSLFFPQLVLSILAFEGAIYILIYYEQTRQMLLQLQHSLSSVAIIALTILVLHCTYALLGWVLFRDVTATTMEADGVMGRDALFTNFLVSFITMMQVAQGDMGTVTRAMERIRPGSFVFFISFNILLYYLLWNLMIAVFTSAYQTSPTLQASKSNVRKLAQQSQQHPVSVTIDSFKDMREMWQSQSIL